MSSDLENEYCCCQVFLIYQGVYLIALHCFVQAIYVSSLVLTSYHKPSQSSIVYVTAGSNLCLVPTGIIIFWSNLYESWKGARVSGFFMFLIAIFNSVMIGLYFGWFVRFQANSQLDRAFFWKTHDDWISSADLPFTFWHILTFQLLPFNFVWFYYSRVMCRLSEILRDRKSNFPAKATTP